MGALNGSINRVEYVEEPTKPKGTGDEYVVYEVTRIRRTNDPHAVDRITRSGGGGTLAPAEAPSPLLTATPITDRTASPFRPEYVVGAGSEENEYRLKHTAQNGSKVCPCLFEDTQ